MNEIQRRLKNITTGLKLLAGTMRVFADMMEGLARSAQELAEVGDLGEEE